MRQNVVHNIFDVDEFIASNDGQQENKIIAHFTDDPLALSCASYRAWVKSPVNRWASFDTVIVDREDRMMADELRAYYNARYTMLALTGKQLSEYQHKTASFLAGTHKLTTDELGLLYRLPYFYVEDCAMDRIVSQTVSVPDPYRVHSKIDQVLEPLEEVFKSRRNGEDYQFWFKTSAGEAAVLELRSGNPLLAMFRSIYKQPSVTFKVSLSVDKYRGKFLYNKLINPELVF